MSTVLGAEETAPLTIQYVPPTPDDGATISTQTVTINVTSNMNLTSAILVWRNNSTHDFKISINETLQSKWGFKYPVTYVFNIPDGSSNIRVFKRDSLSEGWKQLPEKTSDDFFNGIECVRFDHTEDKAYVSVGFNTANNIYLKFANVSSATYDSIARYYDNRKATYTLSNDNWGKLSSANPGAPWQGMTNDSSDKYQAMVHACRLFNLPVSIAINSYDPSVSVILHINITDDLSTAADAWITVELHDTEWLDEGDLYVNGNGPIDLPMTGDFNTHTFNINIPVSDLVNGVNEFKFEYAGSTSSWGYNVNALTLTVEYPA